MEAVLGIFFASLAGSPHCAAMCGPFLAFAAAGDSRGDGPARKVSALAAYHAGRLASYALLGAMAGTLGAGVERLGALAGISRTAAIVAGGLMVFWGVDTLLALRGPGTRRWHPPPGMQRALSKVTGRAAHLPGLSRPALTGLSTALLPCGWLYAFVATAGGTGSPGRAMLVMLIFWTGTLPVMVTLGFGLQRLAGPLRRSLPFVTASVVVAIGLLTIAGRLTPGGRRSAPITTPVHADHR